MPEPETTVENPKYPLHAMTTYELRDYRRALERAIASADTEQPPALVRADLHARLDDVQAEEQSRARITANA